MLTFTLAVFLLMASPGPGVFSLAGVGAAFGWQQGIKYLFGLFLGNNLVCLAVICSLATIMLGHPIIRTTLLILSIFYLGYLALRIAFSGTNIAFIYIPKPGLLTGFTLQLINPKAYAVNMTLFGGFAFYPSNFFLETVAKLLIANLTWIVVHFLWLYVGTRINRLELQDRSRKLINIFMAIALLLVIGLSFWPILV